MLALSVVEIQRSTKPRWWFGMIALVLVGYLRLNYPDSSQTACHGHATARVSEWRHFG